MTESRPNTAAQPAASRLGTYIGGWRLDAHLASPHGCEVYAASNRNGERADIRIYHRNAHARRRAFREHDVLARVGVAIPRLLSTDVTGTGELYTVVNYTASRPLSGLIGNGLSGPALAAEVGGRICDALKDVHANGWSLGLFNIDNVHLDSTGQVFFHDWSLAAGPGMAIDPETMQTDGHPPEGSAPELRRNMQPSAATDVFSTMLIVLSVLLGKDARGVAPRDVPSAMRAALSGTGDEWARQFNQLTAAALVSNPDGRLSDCGEMGIRLAPIRPESGDALAAYAEANLTQEADEGHRSWQSVASLQQLFDTVERVLYTIRRQGWSHPASTAAIAAFCEDLVNIVGGDPDGISFDIAPWEFRSRGRAIWTPSPPLDRIPYQLFASGFRSITILPGLSFKECRQFVHWLLLNPANDLSNEDDMATAWWRHAFDHVSASLVSSVVLSELEEYEELEAELARLKSSSVHRAGSRLRARLTGVGDGNEISLEQTAGDTLSPDVTAAAARLREMWPVTPEHESNARVASIVMDAWEDALVRGDDSTVQAAFISWTEEHLRDGQVADALEVWANLHAVLDDGGKHGLSRAFESPDLMEQILLWCRSAEGEEHATALFRLALVVESLGPRPWHRVAAWTAGTELDTEAETTLEYLVRHGSGESDTLSELLPMATAIGAATLLEVAAQSSDAAAEQAIFTAIRSPHVSIRLEALRLLILAGSELVGAATSKLVDSGRELRREVLALVTELGASSTQGDLSSVLSTLSARAQRREFHAWPLADRHALITTVWSVNPVAGEALAVDVLEGDRLIADNEHEASRRLAAELLAEFGGEVAYRALKRQAERLVTSSHELQKTARDAFNKIARRLESEGLI